MEATVPQTQMTDEQYIAAIEEMQGRIEASFARMDELDSQTQGSMERTKNLLSRIEALQAGRKS